MKSKVLKVRNLPQNEVVIKRIRLKPMLLLSVLTAASVGLLFLSSYTLFAILILIVACFFLFILPNRTLMEFTGSFAVLYNCKSQDECTLIYWDEVMSYEYHSHAKGADVLTFVLTDETVYSIECFSKASVAVLLAQYLPGKEVKKVRRFKA